MENKSNNVHFYVAKDLNGLLWLYLGKPIRRDDYFGINNNSTVIGCLNVLFKKYGFCEDDFKDLKWEDEPVEVFLNMEN